MKENCWEFMKCGRESGGLRVEELGVCPAAIEKDLDGINSGKNAGRCCSAISGTLCTGRKQGDFTQKVLGCIKCKFYIKVFLEEKDEDYKSPLEVIKILEERKKHK